MALRLELRPSLRLAAAIVVAHAGAALAVIALRQDIWGATLAAALCALGAAAAWHRALLRGQGAVRALELADGEALMELGDGRKLRAPVAARRYVSRLFVVLLVGWPAFPWRGGRALLVTADMVGPGPFRRLRLWALWGRLPDVAARQLAG